ncbi:MAG TPA: AsmA-like C-terminal region-containing protein [Terriglobales bacterium]|nr:AsmA-like C-terminal region-containing protein [Terriglobales bacterium]
MSKTRWLRMLAVVTALVAVAVGIGILALNKYFAPLLRKQAIAMLSDRFSSEVEIEDFHASLFQLQVWGGGVVFRHHGRRDVPPLFTIGKFFGDVDLLDVFGLKWRIRKVKLDGLIIHVPPRDKRQFGNTKIRGHEIPAAVDELICDNAQLVLIPSNPGKEPHVFEIHHLIMNEVGLGRAARFQTTLTNPTPPGEIHAVGQFGPWQKDQPSTTPVKASYSFANADLGVFKGISGILSSSGEFGGPLDELDVKGQTTTPDFEVMIGGHKMALTTDFHATVDGSNGDTLLHPVVAKFLNSTLTANGGIVKSPKGKGKVIQLEVEAVAARLEDILALAVKAAKPPMTGVINLKTKFVLLPGKGDISERLALDGRFAIDRGRFTETKVDAKIRNLSRRAQGKLDEEGAGSDVTKLSGVFTLDDGIVRFRELTFEVEGAKVELHGTFVLTSETFNMHGKAHLQAKLSQMTTGVKSLVLKAVDPFFRKDGETQLPIKVTGTREHPSFGLDL